MNILPKKSWHVRTRKNIERVQRDEAEAERLSNIERDRRLRAEQEARIRELRIRAGIHDEEQNQHIDLFRNYHDAQQSSNPDHEAEQRQRDAARRVRAGLSNSLTRPQDVDKPWYCDAASRKPTTNRATSDLITSIYDPMTAIRHAEEIVRRRRAEQARINPTTSTVGRTQSISAIRGPKPESDSSPEVVCEIKKPKLETKPHRKHSKHEVAHKIKKTRHRHRHELK